MTVLRAIPTLRDAFADYSDDEILRAMQADSAAAPAASAYPRLAEFDLLASCAPLIGDAHAGSFLFAETLDHESLAMEPRWRELLKGVVKVHRLREVTCLYGFTRLEPAPTSSESEMDEIKLAVDGADLARVVEWLPALEQFGEGISLYFSPGGSNNLGRQA